MSEVRQAIGNVWKKANKFVRSQLAIKTLAEPSMLCDIGNIT